MISSLELARQCGISQGTVDRALHNRPGVSHRTRQRILRVARQSGYRPNPLARELLTGQSNIIGAVVPTVNNIFFMDLFSELGRALGDQQLRLQLTPVENREDFLQVLSDFAARRYRLALAIPPEDGIPVLPVLTASLPVIALFSPLRGKNTTFLSIDEEKTGREAVRYLHDRGHRRILHLTYARQTYAITGRKDGYARQCKDLNLPSRVLVNTDAEALAVALKQFQPTAIFCHNDWLALQVLLLLSAKGLRVPEDISVLGVDHSPTLDAINSRLTTLAYPMAGTVRAIMSVLAGKPATLNRERCRIIERATVRNLNGKA